MSDRKSNEVEEQGSAELISASSNTNGSAANASSQALPSKARRNALLGAATGASLVAWHKPVVTSMLLPAHAQTSAPPTDDVTVAAAFFGANVSPGPITRAGDALLDLLVPMAVAGASESAAYSISITTVGTDGENFTISVFEDLGATQGFDLAQVIYSGQVSLSGGGSLSPSDNPCNLDSLADIEVQIVEVGTDAAVLNFTNRGQSFTVPAGDGTLPVPMCTETAELLNFSVQGFEPPSNDLSKQSSSLLDALIPTAHAIDIVMRPPETRIYTINAAETSPESGNFEITLLERIENADQPGFTVVESTFSGTVDSVGPGGELALLSAGCAGAPTSAKMVQITLLNEDAMELLLDEEGFSVTLLPGSVTIPAPMCEAAMTADNYFEPGNSQGGVQSIGRSVLDLLIPEAVAGLASQVGGFGISATKLSNTEFQVEALNSDGAFIRTGTLNIDGSTGTLFAPANSPCPTQDPVIDVNANIVSINEFEMELRITSGQLGSATYTVPAGSGSFFENCIEV